MPIRTGSRNLLTGLIYCGACGNRLCYTHNTTHRKLADGTPRVYERGLYRCYRKIPSRKSCNGPSGFDMDPVNEAVEDNVKKYLAHVASIPAEELVAMAEKQEVEVAEVAFRQAAKDFDNAQKRVTALETEAGKALTGESQLDLSVINAMILKHKAKLDGAGQAMEEAKARINAEEQARRNAEIQVGELLTWADQYDKASMEAKHLIIAQLVERVEVTEGYKVKIRFRVTAEQFLGKQVGKSA
ncbi:MAG: zinc ribbon domain-containing protein [Clostridia bacterium]|nr:zinc ribbon domain-containing protein [Clostridia bacterium]